MPIFKYRCRDCGHTFDTIRKAGDVPSTLACRKQCGGIWGAERAIGGPSVQVTETIESGMMARAVVRLADVEQIMADRNLADEIDKDPGDWDESDFTPID